MANPMLERVDYYLMVVVEGVWMYLIMFYGLFLALRYPRDSNWGHRLGPMYEATIKKRFDDTFFFLGLFDLSIPGEFGWTSL